MYPCMCMSECFQASEYASCVWLSVSIHVCGMSENFYASVHN